MILILKYFLDKFKNRGYAKHIRYILPKNPHPKENGSFGYGLAPFAQDDNQERKCIENRCHSERNEVESKTAPAGACKRATARRAALSESQSVNQEAVI